MDTTINFDLTRRAGFDLPRLAHHFDRSPATARRWLKTGRAPAAVGELLNIYAGRLPWPAFDGFECVRGQLYAPGYADGMTADQLRAYPMILQELKVVRWEYDKMKRAPAQFLLDLTQPDTDTDARHAKRAPSFY